MGHFISTYLSPIDHLVYPYLVFGHLINKDISNDVFKKLVSYNFDNLFTRYYGDWMLHMPALFGCMSNGWGLFVDIQLDGKSVLYEFIKSNNILGYVSDMESKYLYEPKIFSDAIIYHRVSYHDHGSCNPCAVCSLVKQGWIYSYDVSQEFVFKKN